MLTEKQIEQINNSFSHTMRLFQNKNGEIEIVREDGKIAKGRNVSIVLNSEAERLGIWAMFVKEIRKTAMPGLSIEWAVFNAKPEQTARAYLAAILDNS